MNHLKNSGINFRWRLKTLRALMGSIRLLGTSCGVLNTTAFKQKQNCILTFSRVLLKDSHWLFLGDQRAVYPWFQPPPSSSVHLSPSSCCWGSHDRAFESWVSECRPYLILLGTSFWNYWDSNCEISVMSIWWGKFDAFLRWNLDKESLYYWVNRDSLALLVATYSVEFA